MRLLAFDTTGPLLSAAAAEGPALRAWRAERLERGQAERLLPLIRAVMAEAGWDWRGLDFLAVAIGPGGFTAVRTGVAVARALALATGRPVIPVGSLEVQARAATEAAGPGPLLVLKDLGRGQVALQAFDGDAVPTGGVRLLDHPAAAQEAARAPRLAGDGVLALGKAVDPATPVIVASLDARYVARTAWLQLSGGEKALSGSDLRPFYSRPPDAAPAAGRPLLAAAPPA